MKRLLNGLSYSIFWLWNLAFLAVVYAGIAPTVGAWLVTDWRAGQVPEDLILTLIGLMVVPAVCTAIGFFRFRRQPPQLLRLFYGVEAPLFLACLLRLFLIREVTPATGQILGTIGLCVAVFLIELLFGYAARRPWLAGLQLVGHSLMVWVGVFTSTLFAFYALPTGWVMLEAFFQFHWLRAIWEILRDSWLMALWWLPVGFLLFVLSGALFVAFPLVLVTIYYQSWQRVLLAFAAEYGRWRTWAGTVAVVLAWLLVFFGLQQQPQIPAFQALAQTPTTEAARQAVLQSAPMIRQGLVNAYLQPYRYLGIRQENNHIQVMYEDVFKVPSWFSGFLQDFYNQLMSPFLYNGDRADETKAAELYAAVFDLPIQKGERQAINHALESTYNRTEAKAGLLSINQEYVWLKEQRVNVQERGDWADVELYEVYENRSPEQLDEEVLYSFSLPEHAVITGLWLGNSEDLTQRFAFTVSPRGAAQEVYNRQVQRNVDPALIEQVGPRQYRLRAFPVPGRRGEVVPPRLHLWLTYQVMQQAGAWPMPQLGERRNVYWNRQTQRRLNGKPIAQPNDQWLPASVPATKRQAPTLHQTTLASGAEVTAKPLAEREYRLPQGQRFAIVLDGSYSMGKHLPALRETLAWLKQQGLKQNQADLYLTSAPGMSPRRVESFDRFEVSQTTFYGTLQFKEMLQQFAQLRQDRRYDAILLVTDEGSYELSNDKQVDKQALAALTAPLWLVHIGGQLPPAYDDATLQVMQTTGGGVATEPREVLQRIATKTALGPSTLNVMDGYAWLLAQKEPTAAGTKTGFDPIAARQLILGLSRKAGPVPSVEQLDQMHAIAKTYDVVTPYSSMIVLVNDQQRQELKAAENRKDRFDREVETGAETLSKPSQPLTVSGVPEPEEWLLLIVVAIGLILMVRTRQRSAHDSHR